MEYNASVWYNTVLTEPPSNTSPKWVGSQDDFLRAYPSPPTSITSPWTGTVLSSGTVTFPATALGVVLLSAASTTDNSGAQIQESMFPYTVALGNTIDYRCKVKLSDATQSEFFCGLAIADTTILDGGGTLASGITTADYVGFYTADNTAALSFRMTGTDGAALTIATVATLADATYVDLMFRIVSDPTTLGKGNVYLYVNNTNVGGAIPFTSFMSSAAAAALGQSCAFVSGDASGTKTATVDYSAARQTR